MAMRKAFLSPDGNVISREKREEFLTSSAYLLRQFKNARISVRLIAMNQIYIDTAVPTEHWTPFKLEVKNIITEDPFGKVLAHPLLIIDTAATKLYRTRAEGERDFDALLDNHTDSFFDAKSGELKEVGNELAPPDPDSPTEPSSLKGAEAFGSW